ncbi:hypothetical protein jhhlp_004307 [Lomentospora prolificans]|uniref:G domain-containing protein n=1 Tax=Lomentospora prolificans TaxID=41688 RepID=A0A2N3NBB0_9PEZI|nr:hypothetical protein jhhlp_004307 [Lomentospora prolificans]
MHRALSSSRLRPIARLSQSRLTRSLSLNSLWPCTSPARHALKSLAVSHHPLPARFLHTPSEAAAADVDPPTDKPALRRLPLQCTGCGAFTQTTDPAQAGYFNLQRRAVREYLGLVEPKKGRKLPVDEAQEDKIVEETLARLDPAQLEALGLTRDELVPPKGAPETETEVSSEPATPVCERCQDLTHYNKGAPILHPSVHSIAEIIGESPHKYNHIYHLIDAADFPMSLVPRLHALVGDVNLRSQNRRSRKGKFFGNRRIDMSFIITRSDLLAPKEEQVNALMPYLRDVLRDALGRVGRRVRLGNVHCVSANRGWWTTSLKKQIYERGGAGWMVGKANVGKSSLFSVVFPKGHMQNGKAHGLPPLARPLHETAESGRGNSVIEQPDELDVGEWLPPARPETNYPAMPTVSALPGTTASPIRIPFGNGKGELIDLPGLARSQIEEFVQPEHRSSIIMKKRIKADQESIKPGQSLLLGGFIRITPRTPDLVFLAASFTPLEIHVTSTPKAISIQKQEGHLAVENISVPGTGEKIECAGSFELAYDVTKQRAGPLTRKDAFKFRPEDLAFRVLATDILIEGVGWVEIAVQVRTKDYPHKSRELETPDEAEETETVEEEEKLDPWEALERATNPTKTTTEMKKPAAEARKQAGKPQWPIIDVFTPEGRFIGSRRPMNGYLLNKPKTKPVKHQRRSMKGAKKRQKMAKRAARAANLGG